jgi:ketosteroid isomerase-like protein
MRRPALLLALAFAFAAPAHAGEPSGARAATADLYDRMSAGDLRGVARYVPAAGFTELDGDAVAPHRIDLSAFEGLFKTGAHVALRASDLREQPLGDVVVVTGVRIGAIGSAAEATTPFTMVWQRDGHGWTLRHVHLSSSSPSR